MKRLLSLFVVSVFFIAGCNTSMNYARNMAPGMPPSFQQGYTNGCDSGYSAAGNPYYRFNKDYYRFKNDEEYRDGWEAGYDACKTSYSNTLNMMR